MSEHAVRLRMTGVEKTFGPVRALSSVSLEIAPRQVHGLLGGNGAGKTTLMNVLYGLYRADAGRIEIDGTAVDIQSPRDAIAAGVGMVHQNFLQVDSYTVLENIVLGTGDIGRFRLDLAAARARVIELSEKFGLAVDPDAVVEDLAVGIRQRVEILKALYRGSRILILDEPTTNLTPHEVDDLFGSMRAMVDDGMSVILITHKIRETMAVCDAMTVMRDGVHVSTVERSETSPEQLAATMVGADLVDDLGGATPAMMQVATGLIEGSELAGSMSLGESEPRQVTPAGPGVHVRGVDVANDHGVQLFDAFDLDIAAGEILGIAGVAGNGQVELAETVAGVRPLLGGSIEIAGQDVSGKPTAHWLGAGVAYVPEDRQRDGILPTESIVENLLLGSQRSSEVKSRGLIDWKAARRRAVEAIDQFSIRASGPEALAGDLSGGNIQRVILARAFARRPTLLILHNPTRGLDLQSTQFVYEQVRAATEMGCSVLLISEDLDEVIALSDRVLALYSGRITGRWARGNVDPFVVGRAMTGLEHSS